MMRAPEGASFDYTDRYARQMEAILMAEIDDGPVRRILMRLPASFGSTGDVNTARGIVILKTWGERDESAEEIAARLRGQVRRAARRAGVGDHAPEPSTSAATAGR